MYKKYLLQLISLLIMILAVAYLFSLADPKMNIGTVLLGGSALIVAVLGFAAQPVILDIISGLLISIHKPFEIGDRIEIEGQEPGVVEDITLRHTVIGVCDGMKVIIPNSELNSRIVTNTSYGMKDRRGIPLKFSVSYDTDVQKAMDLIRDCVAESSYTLGIESGGIREDSGPVYFKKFLDSALQLDTTIWVSRDMDGVKAITDVNTRVLEAFRQNGIEIPYSYINVLEYEGTKTTAAPAAEKGRGTVPAMRARRTDTIHMLPGESKLEEALQTARSYAARQNLSPHASMQLELLTEESVGFVQRVAEHTKRDFWIDGTGMLYRIHVRFEARIGSRDYRKLIEISSNGKSISGNSLYGKIWAAVQMGLKHPSEKEKGGKAAYEWKLSESGITEEEIGKSILGAVADDVRISVKADRVELIVSKSNS